MAHEDLIPIQPNILASDTATADEKQIAVGAWPIEGKTVKLARDMLVILVEDAERPWKIPPTIGGKVNFGMDGSLFLPDLETQKSGFTPYKLNAQGEAIDATFELLQMFRGIYLPIEPLGQKS